MNRRTFTALAIAAVCAPLTGCGGNTQQNIANLTLTLTSAVSAVAALQGNSALAAKIRADGQAASQQIAAWKNGSPAQLAIQAINLVELDLNLFPQTDQYAPLIDIALVTAQYLISLLPAQVVPSFAAMRASARPVKDAPKNSKDFVKQWNAVVAKNPALAPAVIS